VDCTLIEERLVAFHFGMIEMEGEGEERARVEGHLEGCGRCLRSFLEIKRAIEEGIGMEARPSEAARERLRREVARAFAPRAARLPRGFVWAGAAAAALLLSLGLYLGALRTRPGAAPSSAGAPAGEVDSARGEPESLRFL